MAWSRVSVPHPVGCIGAPPPQPLVVIGGQLFAQVQAGAQQPGLHRRLADVERLGGLAHRQALDIAQQEHCLQRGRQAVDGLVEMIARLRPTEVHLQAGSTSPRSGWAPARRRPSGDGASSTDTASGLRRRSSIKASLAAMRYSQVDRLERPSKSLQGAESLEERLLQHILGVLRVAQNLERQPVDRPESKCRPAGQTRPCRRRATPARENSGHRCDVAASVMPAPF